MGDVKVVYSEKPKLKNPVFIEGLPGVGNVGKLAAEHLIDELGAKKFADIYSSDFPPQVFVREDGTVKLVKNELYYHKAKKGNDVIILTGDFQGLSSRGQYVLAEELLNVAEEFGVTMIYTLGGYGVGIEIEQPRVIGAITHPELADEITRHGVIFKEEEGGGIIGASGLLLGIGMLRGMKGVCLMGETSGYIVDPNSAREVIKVLAKMLGMEISLTGLDEKADEVKKITDKIKNIEKSLVEKEGSEDLRYIG
ncbi:MAG: proteasome assembly chaperone family protein [Thermoplasmata archaeon]|nr:MAG: proteasome assembly chaperone family protein [Thermoplasmata archaeon]RLF32735.1 MAG: proteasome assembly chaperone family protein [Thermoplasmata archaeon]RLF40930.1 MAG: proteasome assembly chaperone family protein [Thermoplasmata archaeon]HDN50423.1 proteasome assembly chaperone family protein [Thermoplasmatales archaeon]